MSDSDVIGVVILARHGDRLEFFQNPVTYDPSNTHITALGTVQSFQLGESLRARYISESSPTRIRGINPVLVDQAQVQIQADVGGEGRVIFDSALSATQGLWPATPDNNSTLANGSSIIAPLGGYQYVFIDSIDGFSLEGFINCFSLDRATVDFYKSKRFRRVAASNAEFLDSLSPFLGGRSVSLENMYNIFDFINVQLIHNMTFAEIFPAGHFDRVRALANFHEHGVFSSPELNNIRNIAGRTVLPVILEAFHRISDKRDPLKLAYEAISYKPFISLFEMTGVAREHHELAGIVNYASALIFELRPGATPLDPLIRMVFKDGARDEFRTLHMFDEPGDIPLTVFLSRLEDTGIYTFRQWCATCGNFRDRDCERFLKETADDSLTPLTSNPGPYRLPFSPEATFVSAAIVAGLVISAFAAISKLMPKMRRRDSKQLLSKDVSKSATNIQELRTS